MNNSVTTIPAAVPIATAPTTQDIPLVGVGAVVLTAAGFLFKWFFDQTVKSWEKRLEGIERAIEAVEKSDQQQTPLVAQLANTIDQMTRQVEALTEQNRQLALLAERQNVFDQRLQNFGGALQETQRLYNDAQKAYLELKSDLSTGYLRREDWLRFSNILETKLDENNRRFEDLKELFTLRLKHD